MTIGALQTLQVLEALTACGADERRLCREAGIDRGSLREDGERVPWRRVRALFAEAERATRDPLVGWRAGEATRARGLIRYVWMSAETLGDGLDAACRAVAHGARPLRMELERGRSVAWLRIALDVAPHPAHRLMLEYLAAFQVRLLRDVAGQPLRPDEIRFPHPPAAAPADYQPLFQAPVRFRQPDCRVAIDAHLLDLPVATANPRLARLVADDIARELESAERGPLRARVERALRTSLSGSGRVSQRGIAGLLGISVRTLQRGLAREGVTFRDARAALQRALAEEMLEDPTPSITEIARRLGFDDGAAFGKAFRRWAGTSPGAWRARAARRPRDGAK